MSNSDYSNSVLSGVNRPRKIVRRAAAVLAADISGYSTLMGRNEEDTHRRVGAELARVVKDIQRFNGRVFGFAGDGLMAEFAEATEALKCALRIQADASRRNNKLPPPSWIKYRLGINAGEIIVQNDRTGGNTVNVTARLEQLAEPGAICLSGTVFDQVRRFVPAQYEFLGHHKLKNIRDPIAVYTIQPASRPAAYTPPAERDRSAAVDYRPSLAVLPFRTPQKSQAGAYFAEGMVDDIIRALGGLKDLIVVSRSSTLGYARSVPDMQKIGRELDVQYVLHGSVRREGAQVRIAVELSDAGTKQSIWADGFDGTAAGIFELQDRIALRTASSIAPYVRERELRRALKKDRHSVTAYDMTLQALDQFYLMDRQALNRAQTLLMEAVALDSSYSAALSHLAYLHMFRIGQGWSADEHADRVHAADAARRAMEQDHNDALALAIHGHLRGYLQKDLDAALVILDRAIAAGPSCALAWTFSSFNRGILGDATEAVLRAKTGLRLSPVGPDAACWHEHALSQAHYMAGNYDEAITWGQAAASHGNQLSNLRCLVASLVAAGQMDEARSVAANILQARPNFRLEAFRSITPLRGDIAVAFIERLRLAGLPD